MKTKIIILLVFISAFFTPTASLSADETEAYIENNRINVTQSALSAKASEGAKGFFIFYDPNGKLSGAGKAQSFGDSYTAFYKDGYAKTKLWLMREDGTNALYSLIIADKTAPTLTPAPSPAPTSTPAPIEGEYEDEGDIGESEYTDENVYSLLVECSAALSHEGLDEAVLSSLPENGIMAQVNGAELTEGMTVYDALVLAAEEYGIEISGSSSYVSGLGGLSEFDCGPLSGWMYFVNGDEPLLSMGDYILSAGDEVQIRYTCNIGEDLR